MNRWRRLQPVVMLAVAALVVTLGIKSLSEGRTGLGVFQVVGGIVLAAVVIYEAKVIEPRRRAREEKQRR